MSIHRARSTLSGLRLSDEERAAIVRATQRTGGTERRGDTRVNLPDTFPLLVRVHPVHSDPVVFRAAPKDLSSTGVGFFHPNFIHSGTPAVFIMRDRAGAPVTVRGCILRCRHLSGRIHEVGARFEEPVSVDVFVKSGEPAAAPDLTPHDEGLFEALASTAPSPTPPAPTPPAQEAAQALNDVARLARELAALAETSGDIGPVIEALRKIQDLIARPKGGDSPGAPGPNKQP